MITDIEKEVKDFEQFYNSKPNLLLPSFSIIRATLFEELDKKKLNLENKVQ